VTYTERDDDVAFLLRRLARLEGQVDRFKRDLESRVRNLEADLERLEERAR
jgi:hypothetical protein